MTSTADFKRSETALLLAKAKREDLRKMRAESIGADTRIFSDSMRHLVCWPYSIANLHRVAAWLGIKRCWFHPGRLAHYDIPARRIKEIRAATEKVRPRVILAIIKGGEPTQWDIWDGERWLPLDRHGSCPALDVPF